MKCAYDNCPWAKYTGICFWRRCPKTNERLAAEESRKPEKRPRVELDRCCGNCKHFIYITGGSRCAKREFLMDRYGRLTKKPFRPDSSRRACKQHYEQIGE